MGTLFQNQYFGVEILKHKELPILYTDNFNFFRCVEFKEVYYGKTVSELHQGNLRISRKDNRYATLFPGQRLSYWADSPKTARSEVKKWGAGNNLLTFWTYDDSSSFTPTICYKEKIRIIDGIHFDFREILDKVDSHTTLTEDEQRFIDRIIQEKPDCLAYKSEARRDGVCFLFFENGFKKLSLREVSLRLGDYSGENHRRIMCAVTCDFRPITKSYGCYFEPKAKVKYDKEYEKSDEYISRTKVANRHLRNAAWNSQEEDM